MAQSEDTWLADYKPLGVMMLYDCSPTFAEAWILELFYSHYQLGRHEMNLHTETESFLYQTGKWRGLDGIIYTW